MTPRLQKLFDSIKDLNPVERLGELTVEVPATSCQNQGQTTFFVDVNAPTEEKRGLSLILGFL